MNLSLQNHDLIESLIRILEMYQTRYPEEGSIVFKFKDLLSQPLCFSKDGYPAHFTASAWIIDPAQARVLLLHHPKLHKWLQPGGHLEEGELPWEAACREVREETGLEVQFVDELEEYVIPFDLDAHWIPERGAMKEHWHYDIRFLAYVQEGTKLQSEEGLELKWFDLNVLHAPNFEASLERMASKALALKKIKTSDSST